MWVHSSLEQYIQARPWLISMLSLNILTPTYIRDRLIHIPDATCPTNSGNNVKKNTLISKKLTSLVYTESVHLIGQKANDTYYEFKYTVNGDYVQSEITMFSGSSFILLSVIISCLISAFSVVVMFFFLWRIRRIFGEIYNRYLEENRKLAKFKNEQDIQNRDNKRITSVSQANQKILKILKLGMFTANIEEKIIEIDDKNDDHSKSQSKKRATVTFFKAPELYIDYFQRSRSNSLRMFLKSIYESPSHFPEYKLSSEVYYKEVSTRIDLLKSKYIEFWTKEGYKPRLIEEEAELLKEYNIELDIRSDSSTNAYVNIRWKTISEKLQTNQGVKLNENNIDQSEKKFNPIVSFLESEWLVTSFKSNFILVSDLLKKYDKFCKDRNIPQIMKLKLEESNEMVEFGADFIQNFSIPFVRGIILTKIYGLKVSQDKSTQTYLLDVVRIPKVDKNNYRIGWMKTLKRKLNYFLFSSEGIITNLLIVLIHLLIIIGVPFLILLAVTWSLIQISTINQDIYAYVFTFDDIFNSSSYNFWLDNLTGQFYFYIVWGLCCMFFITGLIELICYYATGARDTGKYVVSRTWQRIISTYSFWAMIILFVGIYTAYLSMILVWCILGAVLNPQKFLPFATGAVVIIGFWVLVFAKLKEINDTLKDVIHSAVDIGFKNSISTSFEKEKVKLANLMIKPIERVTQRMFYQAINSFMKDFNLPQIDRETTDKILEGDVAELVLLFNKACGVDKNVSLGLVGLLLKDNVMIMNSIYNLSEENALNGELSVAITEIALNSYNPANIGINEVDSSVILSVKKLFSKLLPQFPHDILDTILQIILEADPRPLGSMWKKMQFKKSFYDLIVGIAANDKVGIQDSLYKFINDIIPNEYKELFTSLHHITKGDLSDNFDYLSQKLNVKYGFLLKMVIAVYMKEDHLTRYVLNNFDKNLSNVFNEIKGGNNGKFALLKNHIRVIHQMLNGSELGTLKFTFDNLYIHLL